MDFNNYIETIPDYQGWTAGAPLPDLSVGPTEIPYTIERAKQDNINVKISRCGANTILTTLQDLLKNLQEKKFTEKSLWNLISLAMELKTKDEEHVFYAPDERYFTPDGSAIDETTPVPSQFGDISSQIDMITSIADKTSGIPAASSSDYSATAQGDQNISKAGPFWACTFLRLLTKEPEGWRRALGAMKAQFGTFYGMASSFITGYEPTLSHAQQVKTAMDTFKRVSRFIISMAATTEKNIVPNSKSHHMFIYFVSQHLSFTGMSTYPMITSILHKMRAMSPPEILSLLTIEENRPAIKMYYDIATTMDAPSNNDRGKRDFLWKYARLINEGFFLTLQNKKNIELLYGLVLLSKQLGLASSGSYSDPENMAVLVGKASVREDAKEFADAVFTLYRSQVATGPGATGTDRYLATRRGIRVPTRTINTGGAQKRPAEAEPQPQGTSMDVDQAPASASAPAKKSKVDLDKELAELG